MHVLSILLCCLMLTAADVDAAPAQPQTVRVMPLGDSITHGYQWPLAYDDAPGGYRPLIWQALGGAGYRIDFVGSLQAGQLPDRDNEGHGGWTIAQVDAQAAGWIAAARPDVILLLIGTNDMQYPDYATAPDRLTHLLDTIDGAAPNAQTIVSTIPPRPPGDALQARVAAYNGAIPSVVAARVAAGQRVRMVDAGPVEVDQTAHPTARGYQRIAAAWMTTLPDMLLDYPCSLISRVNVQVAQQGAAVLSVTVTANGRGNAIRSLVFGRGSHAGIASPPVIVGARATFQVRRVGAGSMTQPFTVTDVCGDWPTFVGSGGTVPAQIVDGFAKFGLSLLEFYRQPEIAASLGRRGLLVPPLTMVDADAKPALAFVDPLLDGSVRWIAECPDCKARGLSRAEYVWLQTPLLFCTSCGNASLGGLWRPVGVPQNRAQIERLLLQRPDPLTRSWRPDESVEALCVENVMANGGGG